MSYYANSAASLGYEAMKAVTLDSHRMMTLIYDYGMNQLSSLICIEMPQFPSCWSIPIREHLSCSRSTSPPLGHRSSALSRRLCSSMTTTWRNSGSQTVTVFIWKETLWALNGETAFCSWRSSQVLELFLGPGATLAPLDFIRFKSNVLGSSRTNSVRGKYIGNLTCWCRFVSLSAPS